MSDKYINKSALDGWVDQALVRSRMFKKTKTVSGTVNPGDTLATGTEYDLFVLPRGFIPEYVVVNVLEPNATAASLTIKAALKAGTTTAIATSSTAAANTAGLSLIAFETPGVCDGTGKLTVSASAAVDAKFEVICVGHAADPAILTEDPPYVS